jgi:protease I
MTSGKKTSRVLIAVAELYNPRELMGAIKVFRANGVAFDIVSGQTYIQEEDGPKQIKLKITYATLDTRNLASRYDAIVCISGAIKPTMFMWKCKTLNEIVRQMNAAGKVCAGICCAAPAVALAMKGKHATSYDILRAKDWCEIHGAIWTGKVMEVDGNVITASNEQKTEDWAQAIVDAIKR